MNRLFSAAGLAAFFAVTSVAFADSDHFRNIQFETNVPANIKGQILEDLEFLATVQGSGVTPLHNEIFGEVKGDSYARWFTSRIRRIGLHNCGSTNAVACVIPMFGNDRFFITQNYIRFQHPSIARTMVVYHEARHTERANNYWGHATCPTPFKDENGQDHKSIWTGATLAGEAACDVTPYGSYGSSTILLRNISRACSNCTDKTKTDAELYADDQINRVVDANAHEAIEKDEI